MRVATYFSSAIAVVSVIAGCVSVFTTSALLGFLLIAGGYFIGCIANDFFSPTAMKRITFTTCVLMIPLGMVGSCETAKKIPYWRFETSNAALPRPKKKEEVDKRTQHEKNMENLMQLVVENTSKILENQGDAKRAEEEKAFYSEKGREDAKRDFENGDTSKMKQIPQTEQTLPQIVLPEDIPGEAIPQTPVPKKIEPKKPAKPAEPEAEQGPPKGLRLSTDKEDMPQGTPIPNTSPKDPTPELRAKIAPPEKKKGRPTFVVCSCKDCKEKEHKHAITGWFDFDGNGQVEPIYLPCFYRETGMAACRFKEFAWE